MFVCLFTVKHKKAKLSIALYQNFAQSPLWKYFKLEENINKALCAGCGKRMTFKKGVTQTSNLIQHLMRKHPDMYQNFVIEREKRNVLMLGGIQLHELLNQNF